MNSQDKELIRAARRDPDEFEKLYKKYKNSKADGATIASKMGYYAKLDENGDYSGSDSGGGSGPKTPKPLTYNFILFLI